MASLAPYPADNPTSDRRSLAPTLVIAGAVLLLALPGAVLAFVTQLAEPPPADEAPAAFNGGGLGASLAHAFAAGPLAPGSLFHFTPAGLARRPQRSVTVEVRVDRETSQTIIVHARPLLAAALAGPGAAPRGAPLHLGPSAYNLGQASGGSPEYQNFTLPSEARRPDMPDLSGFALSGGGAGNAAGAQARLAPHIELGERERAGRAPRTYETGGEQTVDVGGSYRLGRNLDVTAGVRYSQDRDRLLTPAGKQDSQAVFVGTQFKF